jgi:hypothetical protein
MNGQVIKLCLDRIYAIPGAIQCSFNWQHNIIPVLTDHWIVLVEYASLDTPYIGKGRWTWNIALLQKTDMTYRIVNRGMKLQSNLECATEE